MYTNLRDDWSGITNARRDFRPIVKTHLHTSPIVVTIVTLTFSSNTISQEMFSDQATSEMIIEKENIFIVAQKYIRVYFPCVSWIRYLYIFSNKNIISTNDRRRLLPIHH